MTRWSLLPLLLLAAPAAAQDQGNARRFSPTPVLSPYLTLDGSHTHGAGGLAAGLITSFEQRPLIFYRDGERTADIVGERLAADLAVAYGITEWLDAGVVLPLVLVQSGHGSGTAKLASFAFGDPGLALKAELLDKHRWGFGAAVIAGATFPLGDAESFAGEANVTGTGRVALELPVGSRLDFALNGGYRVREESRIDAITLDDEILLGLGVSWRVLPVVAVVAEANAAARAAAPFAETAETPVDVNGGARWLVWEGLQLVGGVGAGVQPGYGSPAWRAFLGVEVGPRRHDWDGDRVADGDDRCLEVPGLPAHGGCPPPTTVARREAAPPVDDQDGDGVPDALDQCPALPEDHDGFRDDDGCPDEDNDLDFLADRYDADPLAPEDWDGFEDNDGIPDLDNDRDGVADYQDACPNEPGGADGCPGSEPAEAVAVAAGGPGRPLASGPDAPLVLGDTIHPAEPIIFEFARPELTEAAEPLVAGLARYLLERPELARVEVGVHVDAMGSRAWKHQLSARRAEAVTAALVRHGVPRGRLHPRGYGPEVPVAPNDTKEGRFKNRRVELRALGSLEAGAPAPRRARPVPARTAPAAPPPAEAPPGSGERLPPTAAATAPDEVVVLRPPRPVEFVPRRSALTQAGREQVRALARTLRAHPEYRRVEVAVHTDGLGDLGWKLRLSDERAAVVREALIEYGVEADRLIPRGYGATRRVAPDTTRADRARNRRVELRVLDNGGVSLLNREAGR